MTVVQIEAAALILLTTAAFAVGRWRQEVIALASLFVAAGLGLVPESEIFSGFASPAVITVVAVLLITQAISTSGVVEYLARALANRCRSATAVVGTVCGFGAGLSAFMNDVGALALMMPVASSAARRKGLGPRNVLLPLSFATLLGGTCTLIGTPANLIVSQQCATATGQPFSFFHLLPVGGPLAVCGVLWLALIGWRMLSRRESAAKQPEFDTGRYVTEMAVTERSPLIRRSIPEIEMALDITVHGVIRRGRRLFARRSDKVVRKNDILILEARAERISNLSREHGLIFSSAAAGAQAARDHLVMEAVVTGNSLMLGSTLETLEPKERWDIEILGITRQYQRIEGRLGDVPIGAGDVILVKGRRDHLLATLVELGCLPLVERNVVADLRSAAPSLALFVGAIAASALNVISPQVAFSVAVLGLLVFRRVDLRTAQRAIDGSVIVMLAAMIPVGHTLATTGAADRIASFAMSGVGPAHPLMLIAATLAVTIGLTAFLNNAATAIVLGPIAVGVAAQAGLSPVPFLTAVAIGASADFLTPFGHHNNALVMGPGGYRFADYPRLGAPLTALVLLLAPFLILWSTSG
jgi:di/tricarboxylate transporter